MVMYQFFHGMTHCQSRAQISCHAFDRYSHRSSVAIHRIVDLSARPFDYDGSKIQDC